MSDFVIKDSGKRQNFSSGMRRDVTEGKPRYILIPTWFLDRLAWHLTKGAEKYGDNNWQKAKTSKEMNRFYDSALRHLVQCINGEMDEDHAMAAVFNIMGAENVKEKMRGRKTNKTVS